MAKAADNPFASLFNSRLEAVEKAKAEMQTDKSITEAAQELLSNDFESADYDSGTMAEQIFARIQFNNGPRKFL